MSPLRPTSRTRSRWLWIGGLLLTSGIALYALSIALATTDTSRIVADAGQIQPLMVDVSDAAPGPGALASAPTAADAAIAALDFHVAGLIRQLQGKLGSEALAAEVADLESALATFTQAARGIRGGFVETNSDSFVVATQRLDALIDAIVERSEAGLARSDAAIVAAIIALLLGGGLSTIRAWTIANAAAERGRKRGEERRERDAMAELEATSEDFMDIAFKADAEGVLTFVSEASSTLLGHVPSSMVGRSIYDFAARPAAIPMLPLADAARVRLDCDWTHIDGSTRRLELKARPGEDGLGMRGVLRDISDRIVVEGALRESDERFTFLIETAQAGIMVVTADGIRFGNPALAKLLGRSMEELEGFDVRALVPPEESERFASLIANRIWTGAEPVRCEERLLRADGGLRDVEMTISPFSEQGEIVGALLEVNDITAAKLAATEIQRMAEHDYLTMLPNRIQFERVFAGAVDEAERAGGMLATMLIDLDRFKQVNDTYGHAVGDQLLREVASRLRSVIPEGALLARVGGDEFELLLPALERAPQAVLVATAITEAMAEPFELDELELRIGASVGLSLYPQDGEDLETLLHHADAAMYRAKGNGGGGFELATSSEDERPRSLALESELRGAIERGEFVVYYQPIIDSSTREIRSVEALIRWDHPEHGLVPPMSFIPMLEETGLIATVGEWVLREACAQNRRWQDAGITPLSVNVNLSPHQLLDADFVDTVRRALADSGLEVQYLELELTESAAMQNPEQAVAVLRELADLGVKMMLDDFGTGHSSLMRLKHLPVSAIKIDRSFVTGVTEGGDSRAIVNGMIALAHALGLSVIGEGVETADQFRELRSLDCDMVQGFLFARPLPVEAATMLLKSGLGDEPVTEMREVA